MTLQQDQTRLDVDARADSELARWKQQMLAIVNSVDAIVWEADAEFNAFTFVSDQAERLLGYSVDQWLSDPNFWAEHIHPDDRVWCVQYCAVKTAQGEDHDFEYRMLAADGRIVWLRDIVSVVEEPDGKKKLRGVMTDITARKEDAARLREQEDQYRRIFEATNDGLVITDPVTGTILGANPMFCQMHGHEDMTGMSPGQFVAASSMKAFEEKARVVLQGREFRGQAEHLRRDGTRFHVEVLGRSFFYQGQTAVLGVIRDISEQVQTQQALERLVADRTQELESLLGISRAIVSTLDLDELVRVILDDLRQVVEYSSASLILIEDGDLVVHDVVYADPGDASPQPTRARFSLSDPPAPARDRAPSILDYPCVQVATSSSSFWRELHAGKAVVIDDVLTSVSEIANEYREAVDDVLMASRLSFMRSWTAIPLQTKGRTIGYFGIASATPGFFSPKHIRLASAFADHASIAIENARLYEQAGERNREIERRRAVAEGLRELLAVVNSGRDLEEILEAVVAQARRLLEGDASQIFLPLPNSNDALTSHASSGLAYEHQAPMLPVGSSAVGLAYRMGRPVAVFDVPEAFVSPVEGEVNEPIFEDLGSHLRVVHLPPPQAPQAEDATRRFSATYRGFLAVPLTSKEQVYGVLTLSFREPRQVTKDEVALAMAFADQATLGVENARLYEQAQSLAAIEERQRLAHDLHDSVAQVLYGIALGAKTAKKHLAVNPAAVEEPIDYVSSLAAAGLAEMRALIFDLQPDSLAAEGLMNAVARQSEALEARHGLSVVSRVCPEPEAPLEVKEAVYRVVREALHNIVKHAQAQCVTIEINAGPGAIDFEVRDDGCGFAPGEDHPGHLGLKTMRERVERLGGHYSIASVPGEGTIVRGGLRWAGDSASD